MTSSNRSASALASLAALERVADKLDVADPDFAMAVANIRRYAAGVEPSLDAAFGMTCRGTSARKRERVRRVHAMLVKYSRRYLSHLESSAEIQALHLNLITYETRLWPEDRKNGGVPAMYAGTERADLHAIFMTANGAVPRSKRQIRRILDCSVP